MTAQETTAGIQGTVKDAQGASVAGATVEVTGPALTGIKSITTDSSGAYRFTGLPPGVYTLTVSATNFRSYKNNRIELSAGRLPIIDVQLEIGTKAETVEVTSEAPIVDITQSKTETTVTQEMLDTMPKGRSFQSVIPFAPGARQEPLQSAARSVLSQGGAGRTGGFQIDGASDSENTYMVEGMDTTDIQNGGVGANVPMEFVQEVQIKSSGFEAEYGGGSGVVNVIQKRGSNAWHGSAVTYYRSDALNANDQCLWFTLCGLRTNPTIGSSSARRFDSPLDQDITKKDHYRAVDPGFEIGGPIFTDKLFLFASYIPNFTRLTRTVNFSGSDANGTPFGTRSFPESQDVHNALTRLDWAATNKIRLHASWQYGYARQSGINLPDPDPINRAQVNGTAGNNPAQYNPDRGTVNPNSVYNFGGDINVTSKLVVTARYGYWYTNSEDRGVTLGTPRFLWITASTSGLPAGVPPEFQKNAGFQNVPPNTLKNYDVNTRQGFNADAAYFFKGLGTHNIKGGWGFNRLANNVNTGFSGSYVRLEWGQSYGPLDPNACDVAGKPACTGKYGDFLVRDGVDTIGKVSSMNHTLYLQDAWTVGRGLTLNLGVRVDKEHIPAFVPDAPVVDFAFGDKLAPRLGFAWDVMHNGKMKVYGSYGKFFDIMKYSLPQGSFGGQYWHDCAYQLNDANILNIKPVSSGLGVHFCPPSGAAAGSFGTNTFIENVNYRSVILFPTDPGVDPNLKPLQQHEFTVGAEYALKKNTGLEVRYTRKRLDYAIEDVGVAVPGNELYYIGNPGYGIVKNLLQRDTYDSSGLPVVPAEKFPAQCVDCPLSPKAVRNYDGVEFRLVKRPSTSWFGMASYTYSRLWGNYGGLTSTEISDGSGGRHSPNNSRYFDLPNMAWDAHGHPAMGYLPTDRPHTLKLAGSYTLKWLHQETIFGFFQSVFSGTPLTTCWPSVSSTSACEYVEGHGGWVNLSQDPAATIPAAAAGSNPIKLVSIEQGKRTGMYTQTDFSLHQLFHVNKSKEAMTLGFEVNAYNLFNQHAVTALRDTPFSGSQISTPRVGGGNRGTTDWHALTDKGWNYVATANLIPPACAATPTAANCSSGGAGYKALSSIYGQPALWQGGRTLRLAIRFTF
ncbi:MAG TPA: TonB-dependent receptor [Candidatus Dormibacteraeota bacterium]|nr:TonB-dependent receptor [Candidatus Dormibacteraeota bacterium]